VAFVRQTQMGAGADEVRAYRQPQDRQGARSRRAALTAWTRRQGDRIEMPFAAAHESVHGTKRTSGDVRSSVANGGKADMAGKLVSVAIDLFGRSRRNRGNRSAWLEVVDRDYR
jgi:hypothetical protein